MTTTEPSEKFKKYLKLLFDNQPPGDEVKVDAMRRGMDAVGGRLPVGVAGTPATVGGVPGEWIEADGANSESVVLYLHGGGYVAGSIDSHRNLTGHLAQAMGCRVFAADYRLAPEHLFPAAVDDAVAAYRGIVASGVDSNRIAISGDSAGGGLTIATLLALRDGGDDLPGAAMAISAWIDMEGTGESLKTRAEADPMVTPGSLALIRDIYLGPDGDPKDPLAAPIHGDVSGLPPLLIQVGDAEVLLDDSVRLAAMVEAAGGDATLEVWPHMVHVWHGSAGHVPEADQAIERMAEFAKPLLGLS
ncbi:MAG: monoterpene epsilon-lactone hydrolase [Acidimicrobiales bacterium]|jgi:epsilon-lactone hydrolase